MEVSAIKERHLTDTGKTLSTAEAIKTLLRFEGVKDRRIEAEFAKVEPRYYDALRGLAAGRRRADDQH
jgi:hypothetical protein